MADQEIETFQIPIISLCLKKKIQATVHVYYSKYVLQLKKKNELTSNRPSTKEYGDRMVTMGTISVKHSYSPLTGISTKTGGEEKGIKLDQP